MKSVRKSDDEPTTQLLEEGARSYLDAVTALIEYQKVVQKKCREVMKRHIEDYSAALNLKDQLKEKDIDNVAWPKFDKWDGDWWSLGAEIVRKNVVPTIDWWETCCCLGVEDSELICFVGEWFPTRKIAADLYQKFHRLNPKVEGTGLYIKKALGDDERATFEEPLEGLLEEWIRHWKKVGGMKEVFKA